MKHTKGEWLVKHEYHIMSGDGRSIASAGTFSSNVNPEKVREENMANAKLIAASPDLLEALIEIQKQFNKDGNMTGHLYEICDKAIKKATL